MTEKQTPAGGSAVEFAGQSRIHVALEVKELERSLAFYRDLFRTEPVKVRTGYAKFELAEPPVNLTLNETGVAPEVRAPAHFGIQVKHAAVVRAENERLRAAGHGTMNEEGVTCCFAVQDKIWAIDPDGRRWEIFVVLEADSPVHSLPAKHTDATPGTDVGEPCCAKDASEVETPKLTEPCCAGAEERPAAQAPCCG